VKQINNVKMQRLARHPDTCVWLSPNGAMRENISAAQYNIKTYKVRE